MFDMPAPSLLSIKRARNMAVRNFVVPCNIAIGKHNPGSYREMLTFADKKGSVNTLPLEFRCSDCGVRWQASSETIDVRMVSCSNCYSDHVRLTAIKISVPDLSDIDGSEVPPRERS